jgi:cytochrome P450
MRSPFTRRGLRLLIDLPLDPFDPAFRADPYPAYRRLREQSPIHWSPLGSWLLTRYADAVTLLSDPRFGHPNYRAEKPPEVTGNWYRGLRRNSLLSMNPPDHTRIRRVIGEAFTPRYVNDLRPEIEAITERLLDRVEANGRMDIVTDFALPLPVAVMAHVFGISMDEANQCQQWVRHTAFANDLAPSGAVLTRAEKASVGLAAYFTALIQKRRAVPGSDIVSELVRAQERTRAIGDDELLSSCNLMFAAGHETAAAFIATAVLTLLTHRSAWEEIKANSALIESAVEELLRFEPPVQIFGREALEDVVIGGKRIRQGQTAFVVIGSTSRDPDRFPDPDRLDIGRGDKHHLAFGGGIHACIGQGLARLQGYVALQGLARRLPDIRLGPGLPEWRNTLVFRALDQLPVSW